MSGAQWQVRPVEMWSYLDLADQLTLFKPGGELYYWSKLISGTPVCKSCAQKVFKNFIKSQKTKYD